MKRLVYSDIDGCLLGKGINTKKLFDYFDNWQKNGNIFSVVTGRGLIRTKEALGELKTSAPLVIEDGGRIINTCDEHKFPMSLDEISELQKLEVEKIDFMAFARLDGEKYRFYIRPGLEELFYQEYASIIEAHTNDYHEFIAWAKDIGCVEISIKGGKLEIPNEISFSFNESMYDINPQGVNKGFGIEFAISEYDIDYDELILIGNDFNDIPMFKIEADKKIAITDMDGNCPYELQSLATVVCHPDDLIKVLG